MLQTMVVREENPGLVPALLRIVSGGQSGVDRAALDAALALGIQAGGWCPRGRLAEDGRIPDRYPLKETPEAAYSQRTEWNVRDSDGTLVICRGTPIGGTALTLMLAARWGRPSLTVDPECAPASPEIVGWVVGNQITILNVAGPRESRQPGIYREARAFLEACLPDLKALPRPG